MLISSSSLAVVDFDITDELYEKETHAFDTHNSVNLS